MQPSLPPESAPLEVDRVEWLPASPEAVHVHVLGRWKERPVAGLVLLVGQESGRRDPFPALEEPPSGVLAAFAVPNELRGRLASDITLLVNGLELALPGAETGAPRAGEEPEAEVIDRAVLAERRARRAELAEDGLARRAKDAEQTAATLETQLANLEERLTRAHDERDELKAALADAESRLKAAQQREYAEQQQRIEAQDGVEEVRREREHEIAELRRRLDAANARAEDMAREVDRARRGIAEALQRSEADRAALRRAEERLGARSERVLAGEASFEQRQGLERSLEEVSGLAGELRDALAAEQDARSRAEAALAAERDDARAQVTLLEHELETRAAVQSRVTEQLAGLRAELDAARAEAARQAGTAESVSNLSEIADRLKDRVVALEKRRDAAEAELARAQEQLAARTQELERAKIDLQRAQRDVEIVRVESERRRVALDQANRTIEAVRASAGQLQLRLDEERRERAQETAALHAQLAQAQAEGRQSAVQLEVELRSALEAERRAFADQVGRFEAHVAGLREQVVVAAAELRDALDAEKAARQAAERQLAEEREKGGSERMASAEALAQLTLERARREQLEGEVAAALAAVRDVRSQDEHRAARDAAVQKLVAEVMGTAAALRVAYEQESRKLEGELTQVVVEERRRMAEELAAMEARAGSLQTELAGAGDELEAELRAERQARWLAEAELARMRQAGATMSPAPRAAVPPPPEPQQVRDETADSSPKRNTLIADLDDAAERLRETAPPAESEPLPGEPEHSGEPIPLDPRVLAPHQRARGPWLARAIDRLSERDPLTAAKLVAALLPVHRLRIGFDTTYDVTVTGLGTYRVKLERDVASVEPIAEPGPRRAIDFHIEGTARALAGLAGGGARKRAKDTHFEGSRRRRRRVFKELREPVQLVDVAQSGAQVEPGLILSALAAAIDPALTDGHSFAVAWDVAPAGTWTIRLEDGRPSVVAGVPDDGPSATVQVPPAAFLPVLAGLATQPGAQATVAGNIRAVELLRQWFDAAQGIEL